MYRAIYLEKGCGALIIAIVLGAIPIFGIAVAVWGFLAMHWVYGCKTSLTTFGVWSGIGILFYAILYATG